MFLTNPLEQFEILSFKWSLFSINSNAICFYGIGLFVAIVFLSDNLVSWNSLITGFVENWFESDLGRYKRETKCIFWPFAMTMPYLILAFNWAAFFPHFFITFSTLVIPSFIAMFYLIQVTIVAVAHRGVLYPGSYCPIDGELWLRPLVFIVEIFAYFAKYLSISLRLFANILSGHVILEVLGNGISMSFFSGNIASFAVTTFLTFVLFILELFIAFAQAFLFIALMVMYLADFSL